MDSSQIAKMVADIVDQKILYNGYVYLLLIAFALINVGATALFSGYFKKRGEALATKAVFDEIINQLQITTEVTAQIKSAIDHSDWITREWNAVRRQKLEELLDNTSKLEDMLKRQSDKSLLRKEVVVDYVPLERIRTLSTLYFPEFKELTINVLLAHRRADSSILGAAKVLQLVGDDEMSRERVLNDHLREYLPLNQANLLVVRDLHDAAAELMQNLSRTPTTAPK